MNLPRMQYPSDFETFWNAYPNNGVKGDKKKALKTWLKLRVNDEDLKMMLTVLERQKKERGWRDGIGIPHVVTYLNNARWEDDPIPEIEVKPEIKPLAASHMKANLPVTHEKTRIGEEKLKGLRATLNQGRLL